MGKWHPAKIALVWVIALASYFFFYDVLDWNRTESRGGWFWVLVFAAIITWIWLTKREGGTGGQDSN